MELSSEPAVLTAKAKAGLHGRMLTFLTRGSGAVRVYARRSNRRGARPSFLEPLQGGELSYIQPPGDAPARLVAFVPQRVWPGVREDFDRTIQALAFLEVLNLCTTEGESQPELFALLVEFLNRIEADARPEAIRALATARLLVVAGFAPQMSACVACRASIAPGTAVAVDVLAGGAICRTCLPGQAKGTGLPIVSAGAQGLLSRSLRQHAGAQLWRLRPSRAIAAEGLALLELFVEASVGARPRSHEFLAKIRAGLSTRGGRGRRKSAPPRGATP